MSLLRKICYVTGTRADFGLMRNVLQAIQKHPSLEINLIATGTHLSRQFGFTINEVYESNLPIASEIPVEFQTYSGDEMARNIAQMLFGLTDELEKIKPDCVLLLGDRGEMLAAAIAAIHLGLPICHIHGGERTGTVDEPVRHAISKLSHFHFVATANSKSRLVKMGEAPERIFVSGAPGLDSIDQFTSTTKVELCNRFGFQPDKPVILFLYHPVLQEADDAFGHASSILKCCSDADFQILILAPNSDAGSEGVRQAINQYRDKSGIVIVDHLPRSEYLSWLAQVDFIIGNSSSGIIEAASLGTWVINVGNRQKLRDRSENVIDVRNDTTEITEAIIGVSKTKKRKFVNVYGVGSAGHFIAETIARLPFSPEVLGKCNTY